MRGDGGRAPQPRSAGPALCVAGLRLAFAAAPGLRLVPPGDPYAPFLRASARRRSVTVRVGVHGPGYRAGGRCLFDTGDGWRLWCEGDTRTAELSDRARGGPPLWRVSWRAPLAEAEASVDATLPRGGRVEHLVQYPLDQILLTEALYPEARLLLHAAGARGPGAGIAFCGPSGAGKSTVTRLLGAREGYRFLSDDRVFVDLPRPGRRRLRMHGTPWPGDARVACAEDAPLEALCFLEHAAVTALAPLSAREALHRLLAVLTLPWFDRERIGDLLAHCARLVETLPCYRLAFRPHGDELDRVLAALPRGG